MSKNILTKQQAIEELLERVNDWDLDILIAIVQEDYLKRLEECSVEELESEYNHEFNLFDNDEDSTVQILDTKASKLLLDKDVK